MTDDESRATTATLDEPSPEGDPPDDVLEALVDSFRSLKGDLLAPAGLPAEEAVASAVHPKGFGDVVLAAEVEDVRLPTPTAEEREKVERLHRRLVDSERFPFLGDT